VILEGYDTEIVEKQKEMLDQIAKSESPKLLGPDRAKRIHHSFMIGEIVKRYRWGKPHTGAALFPVYRLPEAAEAVYKFFDENSEVIATVPEIGKKAYYVTASLAKHGVSSLTTYFFTDYSKAKLRPITYKLWHKLLELEVELGVCPYWVGKSWSVHTVPKMKPEYYSYFKSIKAALDPNGIMNPGMFLL
jgi:hypothetical protein